MPPRRRVGDRGWVKGVGWAACLSLAASLTYTFATALSGGGERIDPVFFGMQTLASLLFLLYSLKLRNRIFVAANMAAVLNAVGTLVAAALH